MLNYQFFPKTKQMPEHFPSDQYNMATTLQDARSPLQNDRAHGNSVK